MKKETKPGKPAPKAGKSDQYKNKLTTADLKGKKVDAFPDSEEDKPLYQKKKAAK